MHDDNVCIVICIDVSRITTKKLEELSTQSSSHSTTIPDQTLDHGLVPAIYFYLVNSIYKQQMLCAS